MARLYDVSIGKWDQFKRLLADAGLTSEDVEAVIHCPELAELMLQPLKEQYVRYADKLLSLEAQFALIRRYNVSYWDGYFSDKELGAYSPKRISDHEQSVKDLEILHVQFGSLQETIEMWWKVFVGEQPGYWRYKSLKLDSEHLKLLDSNVATYPAKTITKVRINLVSLIGLEDEEVREWASESGGTLAQAEVMSAYGLHTALFREQDGGNLPYSYMAGMPLTFASGSEPYALYVYWLSAVREARLDVHRASSCNWYYSAPTILS